ncbi:uncharacterized protein LOC123518173 [Portunus trituberculatus]|uniref:uncharacterized protein LOC123518173 n=1 Tax=Portunus trituberculatus TaxID=210409 RepID=UPI001E1D1FA8|nr:uncharacterized protein LOC123518173 [Portunus trituberculatus]
MTEQKPSPPHTRPLMWRSCESGQVPTVHLPRVCLGIHSSTNLKEERTAGAGRQLCANCPSLYSNWDQGNPSQCCHEPPPLPPPGPARIPSARLCGRLPLRRPELRGTPAIPPW